MLKDKKKHLVKFQLGVKANTLLNLTKDALEKKKILATMVSFLEECCDYLLKNLPIGNQVIQSAKCIHLDNGQKKASLSNISYLAQVVAKALGAEAMRKTFNLKEGKTIHECIDIIRSELMEYQMETEPESMYIDDKVKEQG